MKRRLWRAACARLGWRALLALCLVPQIAVAQGVDEALHGCWRSQQVQITRADGSTYDQNGDCVISYDGKFARARCHNENGAIENLSSYEAAGPGQLRVTALDAATGQPKAPASLLQYRIEGAWMLMERALAAPASGAAAGRQAVGLKSVSVRIPLTEGRECLPRGPNPLRIGRTSSSSLDLNVPLGWEPWLVDPVTNGRLGPAVYTSFLVGAFVPQGSSKTAPRQMVLVLDDVRSGPVPVQAAEFALLKKRFVSEVRGAAVPLCDLPDRVCASMATPEGGLVYTELFNVKGRVAMVSGTAAQPRPDSLPALRKAVQAFVDQLRTDNAR